MAWRQPGDKPLSEPVRLVYRRIYASLGLTELRSFVLLIAMRRCQDNGIGSGHLLRCPINVSLHWRHNDHDGVSNHQPHGCSLNRLFGRRSKKTPKLRVTGLCAGNSPGPMNSPHRGQVTRKMFPFDDVIMLTFNYFQQDSKPGSSEPG